MPWWLSDLGRYPREVRGSYLTGLKFFLIENFSNVETDVTESTEEIKTDVETAIVGNPGMLGRCQQ